MIVFNAQIIIVVVVNIRPWHCFIYRRRCFIISGKLERKVSLLQFALEFIWQRSLSKRSQLIVVANRYNAGGRVLFNEKC